MALSQSRFVVWLTIGTSLCCCVAFVLWAKPHRSAGLLRWLRAQLADTRDWARSIKFGIRGLLLFMAVASVQIAAIARWGLLGACAAIAVLFGFALAIELVAEYARLAKSDWPQVQCFEQRLSRSLMPLIIWFSVVSLIALGIHVWIDAYRQYHLERQLERDCGCTCDTRLVWREKGPPSVIMITSVRQGGAFNQAGFRGGEMIIHELPAKQVLRELDANRGQTITVTVASGSIAVMTKPLEKYPQRQLTVAVPP